MTGPISLALRLADAVLGFALMGALLIGGAALFLLGGAPKQYELDALGGAYTSVLEEVEATARELRQDYCAQADSSSRDEACCDVLPISPRAPALNAA